MRGHITKRSKDTYSIVIELDKDSVTGKRKQQWTTVKGTKKDAERYLAELLHQKDTGVYVKPGKVTFADYLNNWLRDYVRVNLSPRTTEGYEYIIRCHIIPNLGNIPLSQLKPNHLQEYYTDRLNYGLSSQSVRHHHTVLHKALHTAMEWGLLARNPADAVKPPRVKQSEMQTWTQEEVNRFLNSIENSQYYCLFYIALFTGARRGELLALRWNDIDLMLSEISIRRSLHHLKDNSYVFTEPKSSKSRRTIALPPSATLLLKEHWENQQLERAMLGVKLTGNDLVFSNYEGKPLRPDTITRAWTALAKRAGLKTIRLHDARHTHASIMLKVGIHPKIVQERLGHSTISITLDTYSHVAPGLQEAAAKRFDEAFSIRHNSTVEIVR